MQRATGQPPHLLPTEVSRVNARASELLHFREFTALVNENLLDQLFITPRLWEGTVRLPDAGGEGARYRLAIAEYEEYRKRTSAIVPGVW